MLLTPTLWCYQSHGVTDGPSPCRLRSPGTFFMDELLAGGARSSGNKTRRRVVTAESASHSSAALASDLNCVSDCDNS